MQSEPGKDELNLVGKWRVGTSRTSRVLNQVPSVLCWPMDPAGDKIQVNPSAGSRDTVPSTLGIGSIFNIPLKDVPIRSRWLPQLFATAKIYHVGAADAVMASITAPLGENSWWRASINGRDPPHRNEGGKRNSPQDYLKDPNGLKLVFDLAKQKKTNKSTIRKEIKQLLKNPEEINDFLNSI